MNFTEVIIRYLYLGTDQPFYIRKNRPFNMEEGCRILAPIQTLAMRNTTEDPDIIAAADSIITTERPLETVKKVMQSNSLVRPIRLDECLFALAFMARTYTNANPQEKLELYCFVPQLERSRDLFQFLHFYRSLNSTVVPRGFGNSMKEALTKWYDKHTPYALESLLAMDRVEYKWSHRDIIRLAHIRVPDEDKMQVLNVVRNKKGVRHVRRQQDQQALPQDQQALPQDQQARPQDQQALPQDQQALPQHQQARPQDQQALPQDQQARPQDQQALPQDQQARPQDQQARPQDQQARPQDQQARPQDQQAQPQDQQAQPQDQQARPQDQQARPQDQQARPQDPQARPQDQQALSQDQQALPQDHQTRPPALTTFNRIKAFKKETRVNVVSDAITNFNYSLELVPAQFLRVAKVWASLMPRMSYRELVQCVLVMQDYRLLKGTDTLMYREYIPRLDSMTSAIQSKISPIFVYQVMRLYEERQRYLEAVKEAVHTAHNLSLKKMELNPDLINALYNVLNYSMQTYPTVSYGMPSKKILVTLDLRSKQSKKRVFGNRLMSCQAAFILLTLPMIKKHNPQTTVLSFTESFGRLVEVDFSQEMLFFEACDHIQNKAGLKTKASIMQPIKYAADKKKQVDLFITVVDSLIRVNPKRESPVEVLNDYNRRMNRNARYVIVSLSRHTQDLDHANNGLTKGVLEIVGCPEETPAIIDAYFNERFS